MVPEGWERCRLDKVAELQRGFDLPKRQRVDGEVPVIASGGCVGYHNEYRATAPAVVTGRYGTIGDVFFLEENCWPLNTALWVKDFHGNDEKFVYYLLSRIDYKKFSDKTGVPGVNRNDLHAIKILSPPYFEQKKIAHVLGVFDSALGLASNLVRNAKTQKKALMQQLLTGNRRLPGFKDKWSHHKLGELFAERAETDRHDLPLLSITAKQGVINREDVGRKDSSNEDKSKYRRICFGDIGYNTMRMWQGVSALSGLEGIVSPAYTIVVPNDGIDAEFMSYLFQLPRTIHDFYRFSQGLTSDTWNLKFRHFKEVSVRVPDYQEQQAIATVLSQCDKQIVFYSQLRDRLGEERKALMQQLLTGKRRVKVDKAAA
jgi:type I restriction enzyme, S subunit